jgi:hypothetical protein
VQQAPEVVAGVGEVSTRCSRDEPGIDAAEDDPEIGRQNVRNSAQRRAAAERGLQTPGPALDDQPVPSPCQRAARRLELRRGVQTRHE